ncbi:6-hydroxymethylpterin diphosphokinase MptE-like protein [Treponema sp.]|uniref:6-hydroxymethylpterin diphosphokinase MptE-like protein n=1 Tax=Treponema sp. TaxID=166 RepID=UPI00388D4078
MENLIQNEEPRLVSASQGFSFLNTVEYKGRFLYSKYNPTKAVESLIEKTEILPGTLILIFSPLLWHGLDKLLEKLPEDCSIIAIEADPKLEELARMKLGKSALWTETDIKIFNLDNASIIETEIKKCLSTGKIKRSLRLDFSAGVQFSKDLYDYTALAIQDIIGTFWKNRITLVKFGRLFSKNLVSNLGRLGHSYLLEDVEKTVEKPILVLGAGEGLDAIDWSKTAREAFYIIAVDAALSPLLDSGIVPDAVAGMESQFAIQKAYTGTTEKIRKSQTTFFADLSSRYQIIDRLDTRTVFFASRYTEGEFFENLIRQGLIKNYILPMGSIGLAAFHIALRLRKDDSVEVYTAGLDFSYSVGFTHAKGTMAHKGRLIATNRTTPVENTDASFAPGAGYILSKNGEKTVTTKLLSAYAQQFTRLFGKEKNTYDASPTGMNLGLPQKSTEGIKALQNHGGIKFPDEIESRTERTTEFIRNEIEALETAKSLLSKGIESEHYDGGSIEEQIKNLLSQREYLFLHFPDGYRFSTDSSFLKRVRAEIDNFLKWLKY